MNKIMCKHMGTYTLFDPTDDTKELMSFGESALKPLLQSLRNGREVTYDELSEYDKKTIDAQWEQYSSMRCSEHCGNAVRDK